MKAQQSKKVKNVSISAKTSIGVKIIKKKQLFLRSPKKSNPIAIDFLIKDKAAFSRIRKKLLVSLKDKKSNKILSLEVFKKLIELS